MENNDIGLSRADQQAMNCFENEDMLDDFFRIVQVDSAEVIYAPERTKVSFIGDGRYLKGEKVGEGSYSKVKEVLDVTSLCRRAVKIVKMQRIRRIPNGHANVLREIQILRKLSHRNVIKLIESFSDDEKHKLYIVLEFCCCNLQEMLEKAAGNRFPDWQTHFYFLQVIEGLQYLHSKGIIHKDIKPGNLLLTLDQTLKITDLGVSEKLDVFSTDDKITTSQGSPAFQPPEIANGDDIFYGFKVDVWSTGVTLYNMATGLYPFEGGNVYKLFENIAIGNYTIPDHLEENLQDLMRGMLCVNIEERLSIKQVKDHIWCQRQIPQNEPAVLMPSNPADPYMSMSTLPHLHAWISPQEIMDNDDFFGSDGEEQILDATQAYNLTNNATTENTGGGSATQQEPAPQNMKPVRKSKSKNCAIS